MMFKHLLDFAYKRNVKQAIGFYIVFLIIAILLAAISMPLVDATDLSNEELVVLLEQYKESGGDTPMPEELANYFEKMTGFSAIFSSIFAAILGVAIAWQKRIFNEVRILGAVIVIIIIHYLAGPMLGLIPMAWLTTRAPKAEDSETPEEDA